MKERCIKYHQISESEWIKGQYEPIAKISLEPDELEKKLNISFSHYAEELGDVLIALISLDSGYRIMLRRYKDIDHPGTEIWADESHKNNTIEKVESILSCLGITEAFLSWRK